MVQKKSSQKSKPVLTSDQEYQRLLVENELLRQRISDLLDQHNPEIHLSDKPGSFPDLSNSLERYRNPFLETKAVMLIIDPESQKVVDANPAACTFYGYSIDELLSKSIFDINIAPLDEKSDAIKLVIQQKQSAFQFKHRLANGSIRDVDVFSSPIMLHGKKYLYSIILDVTDRVRIQQALVESEEIFKQLVEVSVDGIVMMDLDGCITFGNSCIIKMLGFNSEADIRGKHVHTFFHPDEYEMIMDHLKKTKINGFDRVEEIRMVRLDGSIFEADIQAVLIRDGHGQPSSMVGYARDISAQIKNEKEIIKNEEYFRIISDLTTDDVFSLVKSPSGKIITEWKLGTIERITGYTAGEIADLGGWQALISPSVYDHMISIFQQQFLENSTQTSDAVINARDGSQYIIRVISRSIIDEKTMKISKVVGAIKEITDQVRAEEAVFESEKLFRTIFENGAIGMATLDLNGKYLKANPAYCNMLGYSEEEISFLTVYENTPPGSIESTRNAYNDLLKGKIQVYSLEEQFIHKNGSLVWGSVQVSIVHDQYDHALYFILMAKDITEQKKSIDFLKLNESRLEALSQLNQMADASVEEITTFALNEAVRLTESKVGYLGFIYEDETLMRIVAASSNDPEDEKNVNLPRELVVNHTGLLKEAVRKKQPVVQNDYIMQASLKKGDFPIHTSLNRVVTIPIISGEKTVVVAGVGNKEAEYNDGDVLQITLLITGMWRIIEQKKSMDALRQSEAHVRRMIDTAREGVIEVDANYVITYSNNQMANIMGYKLHEFVGRKLFDFVFDEDVDRYYEILKQRFTGIGDKYEHRFIHKNGTAVWCSISATPLWDDEGRVYGSFAMFTDITQQKLATEKLRQNEELLRNTISNVSVVLFVIDKSGTFLLSEGKGLKLIGLQSGQVVGNNIFDLFFEYPDVLKDTQRALSGESFRSNRTIRDTVFDVSYSPYLDSNGNLSGTIGVAMDVTEQRKIEDQLKASEEKYTEIFKTCPIALTVSNYLTGELVDVNQAFLETYELELDEAIGKSAADLNIWVNSDSRDQIIKQIADTGSRAHLEVATRSTKSGKQFLVLFSSAKVVYGEKEYLLSITYDITTRKNMEDDLFKSRQMLQLVLDTIPQRVFWKDLNCRYIGSNRQFLLDNGKNTVEDILNTTDFDLSPEDYARRYSEADHYVMENNSPLLNYDEEQVVADGKELWVRTNKAPLHDQDGNVVGVLGTYEDITEFRIAQQKLQTSEERFRNLAFHAPVGIYEKDENLRTVYVNQRLVDMIGFVGKTNDQYDWMVGIHPDDMAKVRAHWEKTILKGEDFYSEYRRIRPDGSLIWVADREKTLTNNDGKIIGYLGTLTDITQIKLAEEEIKQSLSLHMATLESTTDGILAVNLAGRITSYNQRLVEMWNIPIDFIFESDHTKLVNCMSINLVSPEGFIGTTTQIRMAKEERSFSVLIFKDGRIYEEFSMPQKLDDEIVGRVWSYRDVTDRSKADEMLRQNNTEMQEMIKRLTALRNIDTAITGHSTFYDVVKDIIPNVAISVNADAVALLLPHPDGEHLSIIGHQGLTTDNQESSDISRQLIDMNGRFAGKAFRDRTLVWIPDMQYGKGTFISGYKEHFSAYAAVPLIVKNQVKGVLEVFNKEGFPPDKNWREFLHSLAMQVAIAIDNADLFNKMELTNLDLLAAYEATIEGWARALELRDKETHGHSERVIEYTIRLAIQLGFSDTDLIQIRRGVFLHDIGKMAIPDNILLKPGPLTDDEWVIMKQHPLYAYEMLVGIPYLRPALDIPFSHHEKWDGSGYPRGLKGENIPLPARIFAIVDVWDALTSKRPYRPAWPIHEVKAYLREQSGKQFDPKIADAFLRMVDEKTIE